MSSSCSLTEHSACCSCALSSCSRSNHSFSQRSAQSLDWAETEARKMSLASSSSFLDQEARHFWRGTVLWESYRHLCIHIHPDSIYNNRCLFVYPPKVTQSISNSVLLLQLQIRNLLPVFCQQLLIHLEDRWQSRFRFFTCTNSESKTKKSETRAKKDTSKLIKPVTLPFYCMILALDVLWPWWAAVGHCESVVIPGHGSFLCSGSFEASSASSPFCCTCHPQAPWSFVCTLQYYTSTFRSTGLVLSLVAAQPTD